MMRKISILALFLLFAQQASALTYLHIATLNGTEGGGEWARFANPTGLFVDSGGRLYVVDTDKHRFVVYHSNLSYLTAKGGVPGAGREEMNSPEDLCVAPNGRIYVADTFNHRIQVYTDYAGAYLKTIPTGSGESYALERPASVAVDSEGNIHVADTFHDRIQIYSSTGLFLRTIRGSGPFGDYVFNKPGGIFIDEPGGRILLADTENNRVQVFGLNYTFEARLGWGTGDEGFLRPRAAVTDSSGKIYIADTGNDRVQVFSKNLTFLASIPGPVGGTANATNSSFGSPQDVAVDAKGRLFISDGVNKRVLVFQAIDPELEAQYARNKLEAARSAINDSLQQIAAAQSKVDGIAGSGCTDGGNARVYASLARERLATANDSLVSAEWTFERMRYNETPAHADAALFFAGEANRAALDSERYADAFNQSAGGAIAGMSGALALFSEAEGLNATAARLNITLRNITALENARFSYSVARIRCDEANYGAAERDAADARGNATAAIMNMRQQINIAIIPVYARLRDEFALLKGNVTLYDLPIDVTPVEIDLSLANTLILDSKFEEALARMDSVEANLTAIRARVEAYSTEVAALRLSLSASLNTTKGRVSSLQALAQNYSQQVDFTSANLLMRRAEANLSLDNLSAANSSLGQANLELDRLNSTLQERIGLIQNATIAIAQAKEDIARAERASIPLFGANTASARSDIAGAEAKIYSDPEEATRLALNASAAARAEEARLESQKPIVVGGAVAILLLGIAALLVFTGAIAGVYALIRFVRKKAKGLEGAVSGKERKKQRRGRAGGRRRG